MEIRSNKDDMVFRKDFEDKTLYSISLTRKDADGGYIHGYIQINFKGGADIPNKSKIRINNGWLSFYLKDGKTIPTIWTDDYTLVGEPKPKEENPFEQFGNSIKTEIDEQIEITDDDLPF